jgi:hypothetical protein
MLLLLASCSTQPWYEGHWLQEGVKRTWRDDWQVTPGHDMEIQGDQIRLDDTTFTFAASGDDPVRIEIPNRVDFTFESDGADLVSTADNGDIYRFKRNSNSVPTDPTD